MAYQAKRRKKETEDLELINEQGEVETVIHVQLDDSEMVRKVSKRYVEMYKAQVHIADMKTEEMSPEEFVEATEWLGKCVMNLFEAVFGEEDAERIQDFYKGRLIEMCREITPFIIEVVLPRAEKISQVQRKRVASSYGRKARRLPLGK